MRTTKMFEKKDNISVIMTMLFETRSLLLRAGRTTDQLGDHQLAEWKWPHLYP